MNHEMHFLDNLATWNSNYHQTGAKRKCTIFNRCDRLGILTEVRPLQLENAKSTMEVTAYNPEQSNKVEASIFVMEFGMTIEVSFVRFLKV